jgi:hypothetical protein
MEVEIYSSRNPILMFALKEIKEKVKLDFDFALFALSPDYPYQDVSPLINQTFDGKKFFAFQSLSAFSNTELVESGIVGCFLKFKTPETEVKLRFEENLRDREIPEIVRSCEDYLLDKSSCLNVIIADFVDGKVPVLIDELGREFERKGIKVPVFGGIITTKERRGIRKKGYIFSNDKTVKEGMAILSFNNFEFSADISLGVFEKGPIYTASTRGDKFRIYELNGKPAGYLPVRLLKGIHPVDEYLLWYTPIGILDEKERITAIRVIKSFSAEYVELWGPIRDGDRIRLSIALNTELLTDAEKVAKRLKSEFGMAELCFDFSCAARERVLEELEMEEVKIFGKELDAPVFGYFTHGEIATMEQLKPHNLTSVILVMRER